MGKLPVSAIARTRRLGVGDEGEGKFTVWGLGTVPEWDVMRGLRKPERWRGRVHPGFRQ